MPLRLILKEKGGKQHCFPVYQFVGSKPGGRDIFEKEETWEKRSIEIEVEASLYTLDWGFKKISFELYTYVLAKVLQK